MKKPLHIVVFRLTQEIVIYLYKILNVWSLYESRIDRYLLTYNILNYDAVLISRYSQKELNQKNCSSSKNVFNSGLIEKIQKGSYKVFNSKIPIKIDWSADWRFNKKWEKKYFREFNFYLKKKKDPYDVKFPWELGRLAFLIPFAQAYSLDSNNDHIVYISSIIEDWNKSNQYAYSIQWVPMECSVRSINLLLLYEILNSSKKPPELLLKMIASIILKHGCFLWITREYSDLRANHYIANITAILLISLAFPSFPLANKWMMFTKNEIRREFPRQYLGGFNGEKSIAYHRFVTELFLFAFIGLSRKTGIQLSQSEKSLFNEILSFTKQYLPSSKQAPNIGDNDGASLLLFDGVDIRDHNNLISLLEFFLKKPITNTREFSSLFWLFGVNLKKNKKKSSKNYDFSSFCEKAGVLISRKLKNYFFMDIGENGLFGTGGHGHNDLFSFELHIKGVPIIIDPGCNTYTGDLEEKLRMKSSLSHNIAVLDEIEIADLVGNWGIKNQAIATIENLEINKKKNRVKGRFYHDGYTRLEKPARIFREIQINESFDIEIIDSYKSKNEYELIQFFHFHPNICPILKNNSVYIKNDLFELIVEFQENMMASLEPYRYSYSYGYSQTAQKLVLRSKKKALRCSTITIRQV